MSFWGCSKINSYSAQSLIASIFMCVLLYVTNEPKNDETISYKKDCLL